jgi:hypothetical protein
MNVRAYLAVFTLAGVLSGCVGPATTVAAYKGKALHAAGDALSQVETAVLAADSLLSGRLMQPYTEVVISQAETDLSSIQNSFDSIQPPNSADSDKLRSTVDAMLSDGLTSLSELRIALRRSDTNTVRHRTDALRHTADQLDRFDEEHS